MLPSTLVSIDDEAARLRALADLDVMDTAPEQEFDAIVQAAALVCDAPISLLTLINHDRQWFKANTGLDDISETSRELAFCAHTIRQQGLLEVPDAQTDPRFAQNALVTSDPNIRFYAGIPLVTTDGARLGALCVIDRKPRELDDRQRAILAHLALAAVRALESRRSARRYLQSEARFRALSESAPLGVSASDASGGVTYSNSRWQEIYGLTFEQGLGEGWSKPLHEADRARTSAQWLQAVRDGVGTEVEFRIRRNGNEIRHVRAITRPVLDANQVLTGHTGFVEDITERVQVQQALLAEREALGASQRQLRQLAAQLSDADRRKNEFLATLAHELRNPLAPLRTGLEIIKRTGGEGGAGSRARETMERQLDQLVHLVDDLLDVARISSGKVALRRQRVSLQSVLATALETTAPMVAAGRHQMDLRVTDAALPVDGDATRLAQVIANLVGNACKYTPQGGRIELVLDHAGGQAQLSVSDNGDGIAAQVLPLVFEMFSQAPRHEVRTQGGLGIGLALVRTLVELHGGTVRAQSPGPGAGSTFTVTLPLAQAHAVAEPAAAARSLAPVVDPVASVQGAPLRILVVDDNRDAAESLSALLEMDGHATRISYDGPSATRTAHDFLPHVVLLDIGLPGMSGHEVARSMRASAALATVLIVAVTGWGAERDRAESLAAGFDRHLTKPIDLTQLAQVLEMAAQGTA